MYYCEVVLATCVEICLGTLYEIHTRTDSSIRVCQRHDMVAILMVVGCISEIYAAKYDQYLDPLIRLETNLFLTYAWYFEAGRTLR